MNIILIAAIGVFVVCFVTIILLFRSHGKVEGEFSSKQALDPKSFRSPQAAATPPYVPPAELGKGPPSEVPIALGSSDELAPDFLPEGMAPFGQVLLPPGDEGNEEDAEPIPFQFDGTGQVPPPAFPPEGMSPFGQVLIRRSDHIRPPGDANEEDAEPIPFQFGAPGQMPPPDSLRPVPPKPTESPLSSAQRKLFRTPIQMPPPPSGSRQTPPKPPEPPQPPASASNQEDEPER